MSPDFSTLEGTWVADMRVRVSQQPRYPTLVLLTVLSGLFAVGFTITILAVSIPRLADDLGSTTATLTWILTGPILAAGVLSPAAGKAGDVFGHKRLYLIGAVAAAVLSIATALAWDAGSLIAFRVLGAGAGAALAPSSQAIINRLTPPAGRVRAMGWFSFVAAGAPVLGVVAGGPVVEHLSWRLVFAVQAPMLLAVAAVGMVVLPDLERRARTTFDVAGALTLAVGVTGALFALNRGAIWGWTSPAIIASFAVSPLFLGLFIRVERRTAHPLIPLEFFRRRNFVVPAVAQGFVNFAYMGGFILTPLFLAEIKDYGETRIGLISISRPVFFAAAGPLAGLLAVRFGERRAGVVGAIAVAGSMLGLAGLTASSPDVQIVAALALSGIGLGASQPAMHASIANAVDEDDLGIAGATIQLTSQVGVVAGIQLMQTLQAAREPIVGAAQGYSEAYALGFVAAACAVLAAWFLRSADRSIPNPAAMDPRARPPTG